VDLFCYRLKTAIGALSAALGGLDSLIFSGGIGENSHEIRSRVCDGLGYLGIALDDQRNAAGELLISTDTSLTKIRVIQTDEEAVLVRAALRLGFA
jgi:acetate kinase